MGEDGDGGRALSGLKKKMRGRQKFGDRTSDTTWKKCSLVTAFVTVSCVFPLQHLQDGSKRIMYVPMYVPS